MSWKVVTPKKKKVVVVFEDPKDKTTWDQKLSDALKKFT